MYSLLDEYGVLFLYICLLIDHKAQINAADVDRHSLIHTIFGRFKEALSQAQILKKRLYPSYVKILEKNITEATENLHTINLRLQSPVVSTSIFYCLTVQFSDPKSIPQSLLIDLADIRAQVTTLKMKIDCYAEYQATLELLVGDTSEGLRHTLETLTQIEVRVLYHR